MVDYCNGSTLDNPTQPSTTTPAIYQYDVSGTASFTVSPYTVNPSVCPLTFTCSMVNPLADDLCTINDSLTTTTFDANTGAYSFTSNDIARFGSYTANIQITATTGN